MPSHQDKRAASIARSKATADALKNQSGIPAEQEAIRTGEALGDFVVLNRHQRTNAVDARVLGAGELDGERAVTGSHVRRRALGGGHLLENAVSDFELAAGPLDGQRAVTGGHVRSRTLVGGHFVQHAVTAFELASGIDDAERGVTGSHVKRRTLAAAHLIQNAVTTFELASGSTNAERAVGTTHVQGRSLVGGHLVENAVSAFELGSGATAAERAVTGGHVKPRTLGPGHLLQNAVTAFELASGVDDAERGVSGSHVKRRTLTAVHMIQNAVTAFELASGATAAERAVGGGHVKPRVLEAGHIALDALTINEMNPTIINADPGASLRSILAAGGTNGTAVSVSRSNHTHSIPFSHLSEEAQRIVVANRARLRRVRAEIVSGRRTGPANWEDLLPTLNAALHLLHMACDDEVETAEERREKLARDPEYCKHKEREDMHDYGNGPEPRRKRKFNEEVHEDLAVA